MDSQVIKHSTITLFSILLLSGCQYKISNSNIKQSKAYQSAQRRYQRAIDDHKDALSILTLQESAQESALKKTVLRKNKEWLKQYSTVQQWIGVGVNSYKSMPFITYRNCLQRHIRALNSAVNRLNKKVQLPCTSTQPLVSNIEQMNTDLEQLLQLTESHDRYLQEMDKAESMSQAATYNSLNSLNYLCKK